MDRERLSILKLSRTAGFTNILFHRYLERYLTVDGIIRNFERICRGKITLCDDDSLQRELEECEKIGAKLITYRDGEYPRYLKVIQPFPLVLTCIGNIGLLNYERKVAVVGSRNCSINTFNFTKTISTEISDYGYVVVSGLARGVDAAGHLGSLRNGTMAVLGSSIDNIYPKENKYLYHEILNNNGLIVSEFPLHTKPRPENFPIRNRTIAGVSKGVLIISAGLASGSLHTAHQALKYGREVLVFPGNPYDDNYIGSNKLIRQGATMVIDTRDIIENLESFRLPENTDFMDIHSRSIDEHFGSLEEKNTFETGTIADGGGHGNGSVITDEDSRELTTEELVLSKLDYCPVDVGELIDHTNIGINEINSILMKLNLEGKINIDCGKVCLLRGDPNVL
jgi:DNA processing protein